MFSTFIYNPLYNALILLLHVVPYADLGIAVILLTIFIKLALLPLAYKAIYTQQAMKKVAPELEEIKKEYAKDRNQQAIKTMELYKKYNIRPFSSALVMFIQLPIVIGLYWVFSRGGLPEINTDILYSFVHIPQTLNMHFLWVQDISGRSIILAVLVGVTQFIQIWYTLPKPKPKGENPTIKDDLAHSFHLQMKYLMPVFIGGVAYSISAAISLYLVTSNIFAIVQEILVRKKGIREPIEYGTQTD